MATDGVNISVPNATTTMAETLQLGTGKYIVIFSAQFDKVANGMRVLGNNISIPAGPRNGVVAVNSVGTGAYTTVKFPFVVNSTNSTVALYVYQDSGSAIGVWTKIEAIKC